jgi:ASC-1-like (ASCH) protein
MIYELSLPSRPFNAIKAGTKKVEGRTLTKNNKIEYSKMQRGDVIEFTNEDNNETLTTEVIFVHHYESVRDMLEMEGPDNVLSSSPKTIEHGVKTYHSFSTYKENIKRYGIYALGIKPL